MPPETIRLSVIVITRNEERNIHDCLHSVSWADDIVVVDSESTDATVRIASQFTRKIFVRPWEGYAETKTFALQQTAYEWVLWLDADERASAPLGNEIINVLSSNETTPVAYEIPRKAFFLGKWIRHCGWYPGYVIRLFRKSHGRFIATHVHERLDIRGNVGRLHNDILHYTDDNLYHYFHKFNRYTSLAAQDMEKSGKKSSLVDLLARPPFLFFKMYIVRLGFLDGMHGFVLSLLSSAYVFTKYAKGIERSNYKI
jgi:glycosyltransferase involved in cell wall biosynthesis